MAWAQSLNCLAALRAHNVTRTAVFALLVATGCQSDDDSFEGEEYIVEWHSEQPIDQLVWWQGNVCIGCATPLTPKMIADGIATSSGDLYWGSERKITYGVPMTDEAVSNAHPFGLYNARLLLLLGYTRDAANQRTLVAAATQEITFADGNQFHASVELTGDLVPQVELWGVDKECAAVGGSFFVDEGDVDCDGILRARDCDDTIYCTPSTAQTGCGITGQCAP